MKKLSLKKIGLTAVLSISVFLCACAKDVNNMSNSGESQEASQLEQESEMTDVEEHYENLVSEVLSFPIIEDLDVQTLNAISFNKDRVLVNILNADPDQDFLHVSYTNKQYDNDGNLIVEFTKEFDELFPTQVVMDDDANVYTVFCDFDYINDSEESYTKKDLLCACNAEGEEIWTLDMEQNIEEKDFDYQIIDLKMTKDNRIAILSNYGMEIVHLDGSFEVSIPFDNLKQSRLFPMQNGNIIVLCEKDIEEYELYEVDIKNNTINALESELPIPYIYSNYNSSRYNDMLISDNAYLYSYDVATGKLDILIDYLNSNLEVINAFDINIMGNGRYFVTSIDGDYLKLTQLY